MAPLIGQYSLFVTLLTNQLFAWVYLNSGPDITKRVPSSDREREELSIDVNDSVRIDEKKMRTIKNVVSHGVLHHTTLDKKKSTIAEIRGKKNAVPSCDIMLDDAQSRQGMLKFIRNCPRLFPCADRASSSMISHDGTAFLSPRISGMVLFFYVQGSRSTK